MSRPGLLDIYLTNKNLVGVEIGVDAGAHAESLLLNCDIDKLHLVDSWDRDFMYGFCVGRLSTREFRNKVNFIKKDSIKASLDIKDKSLDFIYFDAEHDYELVKKDFEHWICKLKDVSIISVRGYSMFEGVRRATDEFLEGKGLCTEVSEYHNEIIIWL